MATPNRRTGIDTIGDAPWGAHFCLFYQTRQDLIDILTPYFAAGLEDNESCIWVTSDPLNADDARKALAAVVGDLDSRFEKGQIEILDYSQWYTPSGRFDADTVLRGWVEKEKQALARGFDGLRATGNTSWLHERDWRAFTDYEAAIDREIGGHRMLAICTYLLGRCGASGIIDVVANHQFALIRREGRWETIRSAERERAEEEIRSLARFPAENPHPVLRVGQDGTVLYANAMAELLLRDRGSGVGQPAPPDWREVVAGLPSSGTGQRIEVAHQGTVLAFHVVLVPDAGYANWYGRDITERKRLEREIVEIGEEERRAIGRDLHDGLGQLLTGVSFLAEALEKELAAKWLPEAAEAAQIRKLVREAIQQARGLARGLSPVALDDGGLPAALRELASSVGSVFDISCSFQWDEAVAVDDGSMATHLCRIAQEAVNNAVRHSRAKHIAIELAATGERAALTVADDGVGLPQDLGGHEGMGLRIMKYRAGMIGAALDVGGNHGGGTTVACSFQQAIPGSRQAPRRTKTCNGAARRDP